MLLYLFNYCTQISSFPDISKWDINKDNYMDGMFNKCSESIVLDIVYAK